MRMPEINVSDVKTWFANVDISHIDWRLRWPIFILPLLLIALLYSLLMANHANGVHAQSVKKLQALVATKTVSSSNAAQDVGQSAAQSADKPANESTAMAQLRFGLEKLEENTNTIEQMLAKGAGTTAYLEPAKVLSRMLSDLRSSSVALPDVDFWNGYSDLLAILESGVIQGTIKTPESKNLIEQVRLQYAMLRSTQVTAANSQNELAREPVQSLATDQASDRLPGSSQDRSQGQQSDTNNAAQAASISAALTQMTQERAKVTSLQNRSLILAALSCLMFGLLLWGFWRTSRQRQYATQGKHRNEQGAILRLLDEITPLANGDLRVHATVSEASTGAIADAFNFAVEELRRLVFAVTDSADVVRSSVNETQESAYQLAQASSVQAREIHRSSNYLSVMSDTMAQLSAHAAESSRIADLSVQQAQAGNEAVQSNVDALSRIREQAENTSRLMQRLVDTSAQIHERVNDIEVVAKRTELLALNATIRASAQFSNGVVSNGVGGTGGSFGGNVVGNEASETMPMLSDDIAHLAETLGRASRDITSLSDLIQQDATITLRSVADTVTELDAGQRTALQASDNLHEIDRVSNELNALINDIASKSLRQAGVVKQLSANMGVINNITRDSTSQLQDSAQSLKQLQTITTELRDSVSDFKLPRDTTRSGAVQEHGRHSDKRSDKRSDHGENHRSAIRSTNKDAQVENHDASIIENGIDLRPINPSRTKIQNKVAKPASAAKAADAKAKKDTVKHA